MDPSSRRVAFELTRTVKAHKKIALSGLAVGGTVIVEFAESLIIATSVA